MKKLFLLFCIAPAMLHAQLAKSFEGNQPGIYKAIAEAILGASATTASATIDTIAETQYNIKYQTADNKKLEISVQYSKAGKPPADLYSIYAIKGSYSLLFPFWKRHFEPEANMEQTTAYEHGNAYGLKKPDGHEKVFTFGKIEHQSDWMIKVKEY